MTGETATSSSGDNAKQQAMERLRAARMRMARQGVTRSVASMRQAMVNPPSASKSSDKAFDIAAGSSPNGVSLSQATEIYAGRDPRPAINNNGKRPLENAETNASKPPDQPKPPTTNQHRNATGGTRAFSKKFENYIEYDFSKMEDTKGGFINGDSELSAEEAAAKKLRELEDQRKEAALREPPLMLGVHKDDMPKCFECGTTDLDFKLYNVFKCRVCKACREGYPDKYSLLTKTECREDYLLTDPELRDEELLPHLERPNPHKTTFNNMMLYLRYQVEEFSFKKWNGPEGLDAEWARRVEQRKKKKDRKFLEKLQHMRRTTKASGQYAARADQKHVHEWSAAMEVRNPDAVPGTVRRRCAGCGMMTEEVLM